jgi:RNA polymerase sigma-70 factor (ECF subfamily)
MSDRVSDLASANTDDISDAALMSRLAAGDVAALGPLHRRYARMVMSLLLRVDPSQGLEQAEDLTQEVFLTLLDTAPRYQEQQRLKSWLCGIAVRTSRGERRSRWTRANLLRREGRRAPGMAAPMDTGSDDRLVARRAIAAALRSLPDSQREVIVLHAMEGLTGEEIAEALGIKANAVWVRLHRARKRLQERLGDLG